VFLSVSSPHASQAAAVALVFSLRCSASFTAVSQCKSAIKKNASFSAFRERAIPGNIAPNKLPKCGRPVLCIPVKILAIFKNFPQRKESKT